LPGKKFDIHLLSFYQHPFSQPLFKIVLNIELNITNNRLGRKVHHNKNTIVIFFPEARTSSISLNFLPEGTKYLATIYADQKDAHYRNNPKAYQISQYVVTSKTKLELFCAPGGGYAISLIKADESTNLKGIKRY